MQLEVDLDDTFFRTYPYLHAKCVERGAKIPFGDFMRPDNTQGILHEFLDTAEFMKHLTAYDQAYNTLLRLKEIGHNISSTTHRGYHEKAEEYTRQNLESIGAQDLFEHIHFLDNKQWPRKTDYLDTLHGAGTYILIDDRPHFNDKPDVNNVVLFTQPWNQNWNLPRIDDWYFPHVASCLAQVQATMRGRLDDGIFRV